MPLLQIQQIVSITPWQSAHGPLYTVKVAGLLDGQVCPSAEFNIKDPNKPPQVGETLDVMIVSSNTYGVKVKKTPPLPIAPPQPILPQNAPQQAPKPFYDKSSEREFIIRQNALTNAVAFCTAKASLMDKKAGVTYLEGKKIVEVAHWFAKFSLGEIGPADVEEQPRSAIEVLMDEPLPEEDPYADIEQYVDNN